MYINFILDHFNIFWINPEKDIIMNILYLYNFFNFLFYKYINILYYKFKILFYWIYNVFVHKNFFYFYNSNKFYLLLLYKKYRFLYSYWEYILRKVIKPRRWWKIYFKFYYLGPFKGLIISLYLILFFLMWKRRNTYLKKTYLKNLLLLIIASMFLSFILDLFWPFYGSLISIMLTYIYILIKLN